jgi:hypothetical protein
VILRQHLYTCGVLREAPAPQFLNPMRLVVCEALTARRGTAAVAVEKMITMIIGNPMFITFTTFIIFIAFRYMRGIETVSVVRVLNILNMMNLMNIMLCGRLITVLWGQRPLPAFDADLLGANP